MDLGCVGNGIIGMDSALALQDYCGRYIYIYIYIWISNIII